MTAATAPAAPAKRGFRTFGKAGWAVALVFAFLYAYHLWGGLANLIGVVSLLNSYGTAPDTGLWALIIGYAVVPIVVYIAALLVGRTLRTWERAVVFAVGFAVVSVVSLSLVSL
ncbi:hypothetical protein [Herbiconiux flava]|uniref:Uncharacterized protein n=1 Tax=Herbiconiux flava TaxID=881268 RepID=A0A852SU68_9MICO|nr:hypothetical protein [Herbiconiux flava]NYD72265.1 hypothetical protein [Herbiconiux flava]GLK17772.1 hypothetical protein GCM10017602_22540 [Herbiconiux flava]